MPANLYAYDPTGSDPANNIPDEVHAVDTSVDLAVFPDHGPVYAESLVVESLQGGNWTVLQEQVDYVYSPLFLSVSASTRKDAVSYILLLDTYTHTSIRFNYQAVGMYEDIDLLTEITNKTDLDRSSLSSWLSVRGQTSFWESISREPSFGSKGLLEIMTEQMAGIKSAIANPYTSRDNLNSKVTSLEANLNTLSSDVANFIGNIGNDASVAANTTTDVFVSMWENAHFYEVVFIADDNSAKSAMLVSLFQLNNTAHVDIVSENKAGTVTIVLSANVNTGRPVLRANSSKAGTIKVKALNVG